MNRQLLLTGRYTQIPQSRDQCIMKERPASRPDEAPPPLRCAVQGLRSTTAALESNSSSVPGGKGLQESLGKSAGEWHFTLEGKTSVGTKDLSPKEATEMSRDIKYIGMDVHQEATGIAPDICICEPAQGAEAWPVETIAQG